MTKILSYTLHLIFIVLASKGQAQFIYNYTAENSPLPFNTVRCLESSSSALWIGTDEGLAKLSGGNNWTIYNAGNSGLWSNDVRALKNDGDSLLWIGTVQGGLFSFDGLNWTNYTPLNSGLGDYLVRGIDIDIQGNIWIATTEGLFVYDRTNWDTYTTNDGLLSNNTTTICAAGNTKYIGTINGGVLYFDETNNFINHTIVSSGIPDNSALDIEIDNNGRPWFISPAAGLFVDDGDGGPWDVFNSGNSAIASNSLLCLQHGVQGQIFIGTETDGIITKNGNQYSNLNIDNSALTDNHILCLEKNEENTLWAGTFNGGLCEIHDIAGLLQKGSYPPNIHPTIVNAGASIHFSKNVNCTYSLVNMLGDEFKTGTLKNSRTINIPKTIKPGVVFIYYSIDNTIFTRRVIVH